MPVIVTLEDIRRTIRDESPTLRADFGVRSIGIFGSWVRGEQRADSDLDLLVDFHRPPDLLRFVSLERYLSERIAVKVDLVARGALKKRIGARILDEVQGV